MEQTWRQYGSDDLVSLVDVRQAGAIGVITALHRIPNGEVWSVEEILKRKTIVEDVGLVWSVIESVPIHEDIKTHTGNYEQWIANYQQTLRNLAQHDTRIMYYNFIPVFDWTRTNLEYVLPDGSEALRFDQIEFVAFEMHILKCLGAGADYTEEEIAQAAVRFVTMSDENRVCLTRNITVGLPGVEEGYTLDQSRKHLELYKDIDKVKLCENFAAFLKTITPVAEEVGVRMAVYLDDPSRPILGPSRIVSTTEDMQWAVDTINNVANGFTICIGSYGVRVDNNLADMIKQLGPHIHFTHLCPTIREDNPKTFHEAAHLNGDVDMYEVVKVIVEEEHRRRAGGKEDLIPMCPDHGHQMLDNLKKKTNPGYSAIGYLKSLAEVRGAELVTQRVSFSR